MKQNRRLGWLIIIILIIIGIIVYGLWRANHRGPRFMADSELVLPDGSQVQIALLTTKAEKYRGFSGMRQPCPDCGLLFVWPALYQPVIVMRDMLFPLDLVWLRDKQIVQLTLNIQPEEGEESELTKYEPSEPIDAVLEVPAGFAGRHNLKIGQFVDWH